MKHPIRTAVAAAVIAAAGALSVPAAASAAVIYPPAGSCTVDDATVEPGAVIRFSCAAETFSADEQVTVTITGEDGASSRIAFFHFAITTASGIVESGADGSLGPVSITLPSNATGTYNIAAVSETSAGGTATATVPTAGGGLSATGLAQEPLIAVLIGGGVLVLAGGALAVAAAMRRRRNSDS
ncbi:cell wall protein [Microbacterium ulmi]|uniref:Cell wall protein n=1 Tax=Microbacterium ulmi TaxID=179095 RepID=A0A7Y2M0P6_9MICO|nr:cell wall protein [Microbacterium ulmi]NII70149.1 hypothetical protein [Microbacterium ulmi]NNH04310.1 cell wall protein [Microbacterium ulmi]